MMFAIVLLVILSVTIVLILVIFGVIAVRTAAARPVSRIPPPLEPVNIDSLDLAAHLAEVIQCRTVSMDVSAAPDVKDDAFSGANPFLELHDILQKNYPLVSRKLIRERINDYSLLFTWQGTDAQLKPVLFAAHQDVVPVDESSLDQWNYPPFAGAIAEGYVWGRGSMDIKCQLITLLDAVEYLLAQGYEPQRTIYLAFGHDEEIGGYNGAKQIAALLQERGVQLAAMVDEGSGVLKDGMPGFGDPLALVGVGEKGHLTLELSVDSPPGHSSAPGAHTGIGVLARAITRLEANPLPPSLAHVSPMLKAIAPYCPLLTRMAYANLWLFGGAVRNELAASARTNALLRTSTAVTMIAGGIKDNILPPHAAARVNFRLAPGDSVQYVADHVRRVIADEQVKINVPPEGRPASPLSDIDGQAYTLLGDTIRQVFGDLPIAPVMMSGATDARHYAPLCRSVYRFTPVTSGKEDANRVHGINERISVENLALMQRFFIQLIRVWGNTDVL
jgi:carboxypeptidase PM20D1